MGPLKSEITAGQLLHTLSCENTSGSIHRGHDYKPTQPSAAASTPTAPNTPAASLLLLPRRLPEGAVCVVTQLQDRSPEPGQGTSPLGRAVFSPFLLAAAWRVVRGLWELRGYPHSPCCRRQPGSLVNRGPRGPHSPTGEKSRLFLFPKGLCVCSLLSSSFHVVFLPCEPCQVCSPSPKSSGNRVHQQMNG